MTQYPQPAAARIRYWLWHGAYRLLRGMLRLIGPDGDLRGN